MRLADYRSETGLTLREFGGRCGVGPATVSKWETGIAFPRPAQLLAIERESGGQVTAGDMLQTFGDAARAKPVLSACAR